MLDIRNATPEDVLLLKQMYLSEVEDHEERATVFANDLIYSVKTLLAMSEGTLCGTVSWDVRGGLDDGVVEMTSIGVNESHRRKGIASKLVEGMIDEVTQYFTQRGYSFRVILLFMESKNEVARRFYSSLGFKEDATIAALYPNDDGSIWTRHL
jgi:ribosomal protein S18 acetylase RimI-like enzyme